MKSEKIVNAYNKIELSEAAEARMLDKAMQKQYKKRPVFKMAAAAMICLLIIGCLSFTPSDTNQFSMRCYAMDTKDGQPAMRPIDGEGGGMVASNMWFGYIELKDDTVSVYIDVGWQIEGNNIKTAEITVDDGYFLNKLGKYDFENIGNSVILDKDDIHKGDMLYYGYDRPVTYVEKEITYKGENAATGETWEGTRMETVPEYEMLDKIVIHAVVTYEDGKTEEKDMTFDMADGMGAMYNFISDWLRLVDLFENYATAEEQVEYTEQIMQAFQNDVETFLEAMGTALGSGAYEQVLMCVGREIAYANSVGDSTYEQLLIDAAELPLSSNGAESLDDILINIEEFEKEIQISETS